MLLHFSSNLYYTNNITQFFVFFFFSIPSKSIKTLFPRYRPDVAMDAGQLRLLPNIDGRPKRCSFRRSFRRQLLLKRHLGQEILFNEPRMEVVQLFTKYNFVHYLQRLLFVCI